MTARLPQQGGTEAGAPAVNTCSAGDGTPYLKAFNNAAPAEVRSAVTAGVLVWSVPWRGSGHPYFKLYDTSTGPVLMTDICIGWAYSWGWPDTAAAVRHVRRYTAERDLADDYARRHAAVVLAGPWGIVIEQRPGSIIRAILHTENGPETRWYPTLQRALDAAAAHASDGQAWTDRLRGADPAARAAERDEAMALAVAAAAGLRARPAAATGRPGGGSGPLASRICRAILRRRRASRAGPQLTSPPGRHLASSEES